MNRKTHSMLKKLHRKSKTKLKNIKRKVARIRIKGLVRKSNNVEILYPEVAKPLHPEIRKLMLRIVLALGKQEEHEMYYKAIRSWADELLDPEIETYLYPETHELIRKMALGEEK